MIIKICAHYFLTILIHCKKNVEFHRRDPLIYTFYNIV